MSEVRAKLRIAIDELNKQTAKVERLSQAVDVARQAVEDANNELAGYAGIEKEITRFRVAATKRGANPKNLPDDLKAKVEGKKTAESELAQAESTLEVLADELKELRKTLQPLEDQRTNAAVAVLLQEEGDGLAQEYITTSLRAYELCLLFQGLGQVEVERGGQKNPIGGTATMASADSISKYDVVAIRQMFPDGANVFADMGERWKARIEVLIKDPGAAITRPKLIAPSDYVRTNAPMAYGMVLPAEYKVKPE